MKEIVINLTSFASLMVKNECNFYLSCLACGKRAKRITHLAKDFNKVLAFVKQGQLK